MVELLRFVEILEVWFFGSWFAIWFWWRKVWYLGWMERHQIGGEAVSCICSILHWLETHAIIALRETMLQSLWHQISQRTKTVCWSVLFFGCWKVDMGPLGSVVEWEVVEVKLLRFVEIWPDLESFLAAGNIWNSILMLSHQLRLVPSYVLIVVTRARVTTISATSNRDLSRDFWVFVFLGYLSFGIFGFLDFWIFGMFEFLDSSGDAWPWVSFWRKYPKFPMVYYYGDQLALNMAPNREYPSSLP